MTILTRDLDKGHASMMPDWTVAGLTSNAGLSFTTSAVNPALPDRQSHAVSQLMITEYMEAARYSANLPLQKDERYTDDPSADGHQSNNMTVRQMQQDLVDAGYSLDEYGVDGKFGDETEAALMKFQEDHGLPPTGIADQATLEKLSEVSLSREPERAERVANQSFIPETSLNGDASDIRDLIGRGESATRENPTGDYNIAYGGVKVDFTSMTIREVREWQDRYVADGSASSAAGKYQIIRKTLDGLVDSVDGIDYDTVFTPEVQDRLADELLRQRGYNRFIDGDITEMEFMENLSQEWASLPKNMGGESYYKGDGLNAAHINPTQMLATLRFVRDNGGEGATSPETTRSIFTV